MVALPNENDIQSVRPSVGFDIDEARVGDGRRRLARHGLNNVREGYRITYCVMSINDATTLVTTLKGTGGVTPYDWTPPGESTSREWTISEIQHPTIDQVNKRVTIVIEEFF